MRLWLDHERDPKEWLPHVRWFRGRDLAELDEWSWVKTAQEAIALLESGQVVEVSLDHDLGDPDEVGDGYMVAVWIEERVITDDYVPPVIHVHSSNVVGRERLEAAVRSIRRMAAGNSNTGPEVRAYIRERFPALGDAPLVGARSCRYELTPDTRLIAAPHPDHPSV